MPRQFSADADKLRPERQILWQVGQLRAIAGLGLGRPAFEHGQQDPFVDLVALRAEAAEPLLPGEVAGLNRLKPMQAEVIAAAFHHSRGERVANRLGDDRQILVDDLFLQVFRAGRDEDAAAAQKRGDQIGERLACSGARLDEQHAARLDRFSDGVGHRALRGTRFEAGQRSDERPSARRSTSRASRVCPADVRVRRCASVSPSVASRDDRRACYVGLDPCAQQKLHRCRRKPVVEAGL